MNTTLLAILLAVTTALGGCGSDDDAAEDSGPIHILVFSKTEGFRHPSIADAVAFFGSLPEEEEITVVLSEDAGDFSDENLADFDVIVFANTTGNVLNEPQQGAVQRFIRSGRGYVGVHSAADTEYEWSWYGQLVGAYFISHPLLPVEVEVTTEDPSHPSTRHLPETFLFTDEIYNFDRNPRHDNSILLTIDEEGFIFPNIPDTPSMGDDHPIAWYKEFDGGRSFYTNLGHRPETWADPVFHQHLLEGIRWAAAANTYNRIILTQRPRNPMELAVADDGRVFYIERTGEVMVWLPDSGQVQEVATLEVDTEAENGLLGLALDPDFRRNRRMYLYHSAPIADPPPPGPPGRNILSSFEVTRDNTLDLDSRVDLIEVPSDRICCHEGGSITFAPDGTLFLSTGDNTNPFQSSGYAPIDERPGHETENAQRTAQDPSDLRGSILRIHTDGSIPDGNLFPADGSEGRPEIYTMGNRNPFRTAVDPRTGRLFWGEVGPDALQDTERGPRGYDEINVADAPGNFGWPYCIGPNLAYGDYDFATEEIDGAFSCDEFLPSALAYDYVTVSELALGNAGGIESRIGFTGRTAIAGVFYPEQADRARFQLPQKYHNTLLMTDWTRDIIASMDVDEAGEMRSLRRILPWEEFRRPIDLAVGPDGALYVLEYGTASNGDNPDAQLSRIEYSPTGDLSPVARIGASTTAGEAPLTVLFFSVGSRAPGRSDQNLRYEWDLDGDGSIDSRDPSPSFTYDDNGSFVATLTVIGSSGARSFPATREIVVGNTSPTVEILSPRADIEVEANTMVPLRGTAADAEDMEIDCDDLVWDVRLGHNAHTHPLFLLTGCETEFQARLRGHLAAQDALYYAIELSYTDTGGPNGEPELIGRDAIRIDVRE